MANLFANFEVNRQSNWQRLLTLVGLSLFLHGSAVALVVYVPAFRDTLNIAAMVAGTGYSDRDYERTEIGENVQMVEVAKFSYPPGYFAIASNEAIESAEAQQYMAPKIISEARNQPADIESTPTPTPEPSPEPVPEPSSPAGDNTNVATNAAVEDNPDLEDPEKADEKLDEVAAEHSVVRPSENDINTRPLKDWLARSNDLREKGQLDLSSKVELTIAAVLNTDCRLNDAVVVQKSGDARLMGVARDMVSAISDSHMLSFLRDPKKVTNANEMRCDPIPLQFTVSLDQDAIIARVESQAESAERASEMARGYNGLLTLGQFAKRGRDEEILYKSTKVTSEGKLIVVSFTLPRQTAGEMLKKQLPSSG